MQTILGATCLFTVVVPWILFNFASLLYAQNVGPVTSDVEASADGEVKPDDDGSLIPPLLERPPDEDPDMPAPTTSALPKNLAPEMFFDADSTQFTSDGKQQVFQGNVVAVGGGVLMTADRISLDRSRQELIADGHVIILTENQVYLGDRIVYRLESTDFLMINSVMIANDPRETERVSREVLGFTPRELAFETMRRERIEAIEARKRTIRERYLEASQVNNKPPTQEVVDKYSLLLEQEDLTRSQENPVLAKMTEDRRRRFKERRKHWERGLLESQRFKKQNRVTAFFRIEGKVLARQNNYDYSVKDSFWTPCRCEDDEYPAWGFRASKLDAQIEGYLDFYHPVLEIKGVPVFYVPYLKVPLKEKRQSGFLMPTFASRSKSGNIYSQPFFIDLANNADATVTTEVYEKRGTKVGLELRYQQRQYSGWEFKYETIRDSLWMEDRKFREIAREHYFGDDGANINELCSYNNTNVTEECKRQARNSLALPQNTWRGSQSWRGLTILAPRLSVVSHGTINSDHRYVEDLTLYEDFNSALDASTRATYFTPSKYRFHLDAKNFYMGVGGSYGDNVLTNDRFLGQQMPLSAVLQSRMITLDRHWFPVPIYAQAKAEFRQISDWTGPANNIPQLEGENHTLGSGTWQRVKFDQVSPLITHSFAKLDHFSEWEARSITHDRMESQRSSIRSWRTGLTVNLPIDGDMLLPGFLQNKTEGSFGSKYLRHYMNWALTFSVRPEVERSGPYGKYKNQYYVSGNGVNSYAEGGELVFFGSDRSDSTQVDSDVGVDDTMIKHKRVSFATSHTWDLFDRGWERLAGTLQPQPSQSAAPESYAERAKRELIYSLDRPVSGYEEMFGEGSGENQQWYINRYKLIEKNSNRLVTLDADISYDFDKEVKRAEQIERRKDGLEEDEGQIGLAQPWSEPAVGVAFNILSTTLSNRSVYNLYYKKLSKQEFGVGLPAFFSTTLGYSYVIKNVAALEKNGESLIFTRTTEQLVNLQSSLIPHIVLSATVGHRVEEDPNAEEQDLTPSYLTNYKLVYISPSECWKLGLEREQKYEQAGDQASYKMALTVIFMGRERATPDLSPGFVREINSDDKS
jgi:hypothetical protein